MCYLESVKAAVQMFVHLHLRVSCWTTSALRWGIQCQRSWTSLVTSLQMRNGIEKRSVKYYRCGIAQRLMIRHPMQKNSRRVARKTLAGERDWTNMLNKLLNHDINFTCYTPLKDRLMHQLYIKSRAYSIYLNYCSTSTTVNCLLI